MKLVVALPQGHPLARARWRAELIDLAEEPLISYLRKPRARASPIRC